MIVYIKILFPSCPPSHSRWRLILLHISFLKDTQKQTAVLISFHIELILFYFLILFLLATTSSIF